MAHNKVSISIAYLIWLLLGEGHSICTARVLTNPDIAWPLYIEIVLGSAQDLPTTEADVKRIFDC